LAKGIEVNEVKRGKIGGMGITQFVNDLTGGGGKITLTPNWYLGFYKPERIHVFKSALRGPYHFSPEPIASKMTDFYPEISSKI
ncbi:KamA family radical SAM protein, partial [Leptospira borgpetersenii serovar Hardjo-bovis]|nr:KamA family radical SAM protein [Leptospira borgpetersenii serovar Hardjo-bovis]